MSTTIWPTFDDWWDLYDYKADRKRCEKYWSKMSQEVRELAMQHTERYVRSTHTDGRFPSRRMPGTYLHNANWNDEVLIRASSGPEAGSALDEKKRAVLQSLALQSERDRSNNGGGHPS